MQRMRSTERDTAPSVLERACSVMEALDANHPYLSVSELARRSGLPKSTTHRLVGELCRLGLLEFRLRLFKAKLFARLGWRQHIEDAGE